MVKQNSFYAWILAARPKTLTAAGIPVLLATALAYSDRRQNWAAAAVCLAFAFLMQIAANFINDLYDFLKGTDGSDRLGPERACAQGWITPKAMRWGIAVTVVMACGLGCVLLYWGSWWLVAVGAACVVFAFLYTLLLSYYGFGDLLVVAFFGLVPVMATYYVQTDEVSQDAFVCSLISGVLIDTLLVVNNYRDRDTDRFAGKRTLVAVLGERFGRFFYLELGLLAWAGCMLFLAEGRDWAFLLPTVYVILHVRTWRSMSKIRQGKELNKILGETSRNMLIFALLLALGLIL